jgi:hypothetical protein
LGENQALENIRLFQLQTHRRTASHKLGTEWTYNRSQFRMTTRE